MIGLNWFHWILFGLDWFHWINFGLDWFQCIIFGLDWFLCILFGLNWFHWILFGLDCFHWILFCRDGFHWITTSNRGKLQPSCTQPYISWDEYALSRLCQDLPPFVQLTRQEIVKQYNYHHLWVQNSCQYVGIQLLWILSVWIINS